MKCQDFRELIDSYLCNELLTETNHEVLRHLEQCTNCREVIEERRIFRARLRSAVQNCEELKICEKFKANLQNRLKQSLSTDSRIKKPFGLGNFGLAAVAASLLVVIGLSFWIFSGNNGTVSQSDLAQLNEKEKTLYYEKVALGDHQNCAVKYNLDEDPVDIDLLSPQYANLRQGILMPLQNSPSAYKFVESHICKYKDQTFVHIVFNHQGKMMSVLLMDTKDYNGLKNEDIEKLSMEGYQIAHFDIEKKAIFVISDLPEPENYKTAQLVENPLRRELIKSDQANLVSFSVFRR